MLKVETRSAERPHRGASEQEGQSPIRFLVLPEVGDVSIPDMGLFANARERAFCMEIASVARENLLSLPEAGGTLSVRLGIFEGQVMALMGVEDDAGAKEIRIAARLGYVVGAMENGSGVEHSEQSEIHYLMALDLVTMTLGNTASFMFEFTSSGGYFLARTRDQGLQPLVYAARRGVAELRSQGVDI